MNLLDESAASGSLMDVSGAEDDDKTSRAVWATRVSFSANVVLLIVKLFVAIVSGSLVVLASAIDSFLDLFSGGILWYAARAAQNTDVYEYPVGRTRAEPLGVIVFSCLMSMVSLQIIAEGVGRLFSADDDSSLSIMAIVLVAGVVLVKLALFLFCRTIKGSPSAEALAQDHFNDVITNSFGLLFAYLGSAVAWWLDPAAAIAFSLYLLFTWAANGAEYIQLMLGRTASPAFLQQLTYLSFNHHEDILKIDTVRAFHFGSNFLVEVDIVMDPDTTLRHSHDIGEGLQSKLEAVNGVERAFVHIDYEFSHRPGSEHRMP